MPVYSNTVPPTTLFPGQQGLFFDAESLFGLTPVASIPFGLANSGPWGTYAPSCSIEIKFSADPGVFEIDIQDADTDADAYYNDLAAAGIVNAVDASTFATRVELVPIKAKFIRLKVASLANNVTCTARLTR